MSVNKNKRRTIAVSLKKTTKNRLIPLNVTPLSSEEEAEKFIRTKIDARIVPPALAKEISEAKHIRQQLRDTVVKCLKNNRTKKELNNLKIFYREDGETLSDYYRRLNVRVEGLLTTQNAPKKNSNQTALIIHLEKAVAKYKNKVVPQKQKSKLIQRTLLKPHSEEETQVNAIKERILSNIMYHIHPPFSGDKEGQKAYNNLRDTIRLMMLDVKLLQEDWMKQERILSVIDIQLLPQKEQETNHQYYNRLKHHLPNALNKLKSPTLMLEAQQRELKAQQATLLKEIATLISLVEGQQKKVRRNSKTKNGDWESHLERLRSLQDISRALDTPISKLKELRGNVRGVMHEIIGFQKRIGKIKASLASLIPSLAPKKSRAILKKSNVIHREKKAPATARRIARKSS